MNNIKENITQVGDMNAAMATWNEIVSKEPEVMGNTDFIYYGAIVFYYAHLMATRQAISFIHYNENNIQSVNVPEMADKLRDRHASIFSIASLDDELVDFEIYFVFNDKKTAVDYIICVDFTINEIWVVEDKSQLPFVLNKFMRRGILI